MQPLHAPAIEIFVALGVALLTLCLPWQFGFLGYLVIFVLASMAMHQQQQHGHAACGDACGSLGMPLRAYVVDSTSVLVVIGVGAPGDTAARLPGQELFAGGADGRPARRLGVVEQAQAYQDTVVVGLQEPLASTVHPSTPLFDGPPPAQPAAPLAPAMATAYATLLNVAQFIALLGVVLMLVPGVRAVFQFLFAGVLAAALLCAALILLLHDKLIPALHLPQ